MKIILLEAVQKIFKTIENEPLCAVATLLDPRFDNMYICSEGGVVLRSL